MICFQIYSFYLLYKKNKYYILHWYYVDFLKKQTTNQGFSPPPRLLQLPFLSSLTFSYFSDPTTY